MSKKHPYPEFGGHYTIPALCLETYKKIMGEPATIYDDSGENELPPPPGKDHRYAKTILLAVNHPVNTDDILFMVFQENRHDMVSLGFGPGDEYDLVSAYGPVTDYAEVTLETAMAKALYPLKPPAPATP